MYETHNSLSARLGNSATVPKMNLSAAERALQEANGERGFAIKGAGASGRGNVVEVSGLAEGTTAEDVEVSFYSGYLAVTSLNGFAFRPSSSDVAPSRTASNPARTLSWYGSSSRTRKMHRRL